MGNFLVVVPSQEQRLNDGRNHAAALFQSGIERAHALLSTAPGAQLTADWFYAASFPRRNGSGAPIVCDPVTQNWLVSIGSWFHADGFTCGDEKTLLEYYRRNGARHLALQLEGNFVIVVGDAASREIRVITDICGNLHSFVRHTPQGTVISGSSLLLASLSDFHLDRIALQEFIATGVVYEDRCVYQEVRKLPPGAVLRFASGSETVVTERYWSPASVQTESLAGREARHALWKTLHGTAEKISTAFPKPLCDLTGGYDSRAEVAAFAAAGAPVATIVSGPPGSADVRISRGLARMAGLPHTHFEPSPEISLDSLRAAAALTDGEYDLVEYSRIQRIHERSVPDYSASINGSFGELARGYWWELLAPRLGAREPLNGRTLSTRRYAAVPFDALLFRATDRLDLVAHFAHVIEQTNREILHTPNTLQVDSAYLLMRMQRWHGRIASSTNRIWPCISPFMFRSVLEVILQTRAVDRRRSLLIRRMLAEFQPRWANFPLEHGYPAAPVTWKNVYRFYPVFQYYAGRLSAKLSRVVRHANHAGISGPAQSRLQLWSQPDVQALLDPRVMHLSACLDAAGLAAFLKRSQNPAFPYDGQWSRVLTLEVALGMLDSGGTRLLA